MRLGQLRITARGGTGAPQRRRCHRSLDEQENSCVYEAGLGEVVWLSVNSDPQWHPPWFKGHGRMGPYTLIERIHVGGHAQVFKALCPSSAGEARVVCLKTPLPHLKSDPTLGELFAHECHLTRQLDHPALARFVDARPQGPLAYLCTSYIRGLNLGEVAQALEDSLLASKHRWRVTHAALQAFARLHSAAPTRAWVHRDLSAANMLLSVRGRVVFCDLGLAVPEGLRLNDDARPWQARGAPRPTLTVLSPEEARGEPLTLATDVFAVASSLLRTFWRLEDLSGSPLAILLKTQDGPSAELRRRALKYLGPRVAEVLLGALDADPAARPADGKALLDALAAALPEAPIDAAEAALIRARARSRRHPVRQPRRTPEAHARGTPALIDSQLADTHQVRVLGHTYAVAPPDTPSALTAVSFYDLVDGVAQGSISAEHWVRGPDGQQVPASDLPELRVMFLSPASALEGRKQRLRKRSRPGLSLAHALAQLTVSAVPGVVHLASQQAKTFVSLKLGRGVITGYLEPSGQLRLAEALVTSRKLDHAAIDSAWKLAPAYGGMVSRAIESSALTPPETLLQAAWAIAATRVLDAARWPDLEVSFEEDGLLDEGELPLRLSPWYLIEQLYRSELNAGHLGETSGDAESSAKAAGRPAQSPTALRAPLPNLLRDDLLGRMPSGLRTTLRALAVASGSLEAQARTSKRKAAMDPWWLAFLDTLDLLRPKA